MGLGYTQPQARDMVKSAQAEMQKLLRTPTNEPAAAAAAQARGAVDAALSWSALYTWISWATWAVAGFLSVFGASLMLNRVRQVPQQERVSEPGFVPMRPIETTP
jgi:hypothetical protein